MKLVLDIRREIEEDTISTLRTIITLSGYIPTHIAAELLVDYTAEELWPDGASLDDLASHKNYGRFLEDLTTEYRTLLTKLVDKHFPTP